VLAGGLGTRLRLVTGESLPKALVPVAGRPFINLKLEELRDRGADEVVVLVGHGADAIRAHVGDGTGFGVRVTFVEDGRTLLGTGGALLSALPVLGETFWVTYGDTLLAVDTAHAETQFATSDALGLMTVLHNRDRWELSNTRVEGSRVVAYAKEPRPEAAEHIDYGMLLFRSTAFSGFAAGEAFDLAQVLGRLVTDQRLDAFEVTERFHDIGTAAALRETEQWIRARGADPR
jgi:N-acetyl-alpha-D-muramate 1-phosphate uridylyltransferase